MAALSSDGASTSLCVHRDPAGDLLGRRRILGNFIMLKLVYSSMPLGWCRVNLTHSCIKLKEGEALTLAQPPTYSLPTHPNSRTFAPQRTTLV
jgi:hypothetical protein